MTQDDQLARWAREEQQPFTGWDFSYLNGRLLEAEPPWSYSARATELMQRAASAIDLGTGGGERLLALQPYWPPRVAATEGYPPNLRLATHRLAPFGVDVVDVDDTDETLLPFADATVDLVLDRHAAFNAAEVARVLAPGGTFLTQQVHGRSAEDLLSVFGASPQWPDATPEKYVPRLEAAGLTIVTRAEWSGALTFTDVGAIVYYLKAVPWLVPGFSVATHTDALLRLHAQLERGEPLAFTTRRYLLEARKEDGSASASAPPSPG